MVAGMKEPIGVCKSCGVEFERSHHLQTYCETHREDRASKRGLYEARAAEAGLRICKLQGCRKSLKGKRASNMRVVYCSQECADEAKRETQRRKGRAKSAERLRMQATEASPYSRHGDLFEKLVASGDAQRIHDGVLSPAQAAVIYATTTANVSRTMDAWRVQLEVERAKTVWSPSWLTRAMLPTAKLLRLKELGPGGEGSDEFEALADDLVRAYAVFSRRFFRLEGKRPIVAPFHLKWIRAIIVAWAVGAKQLILSPPRHGKSELLVRFAVWMLCMFPNIRIMWVAANGDVSKIMLGAIKDHLLNNEDLIAATLPPGETYKPSHGDGKPWSSKEIKIAQQSHVGQKSSSVLALGRTSKILSRDLDILITDDLEDFDTTREPGQRQYSRDKLAEIGTRKEEFAVWLYISSRQHPDDIPHHLMKLEGTSQAWRTIVDTAHTDCQLDPEIIEGHDQNGCVLFPQVRSYRWLMEKKGEMDALGIPGAFEMRYLNKPVPTEGIVFDVPKIRDKALNPSRDLGVDGLPPGRLIAGIDPASRGMQAAFAWHFVPTALSMVDLETQQAGGIAGALKIMEDWYEAYGITDWIYEDNSQQVEFFRDPRVRELRTKLGLTILPHTTGKNKHDPEFGISAQAPWYHNGMIDLPFATAEARRKVNLLLGQLELWTSDGVARKGLTDVKMASWFPFPRILRWYRLEAYPTRAEQGAESSYPMVSRTGSVPWNTAYPKG